MADSEHRVIYRAVAKFGDLYEEIARANAAVRSMRDEHVKNARAAQQEADALARANRDIVRSTEERNRAVAASDRQQLAANREEERRQAAERRAEREEDRREQRRQAEERRAQREEERRAQRQQAEERRVQREQERQDDRRQAQERRERLEQQRQEDRRAAEERRTTREQGTREREEQRRAQAEQDRIARQERQQQAEARRAAREEAQAIRQLQREREAAHRQAMREIDEERRARERVARLRQANRDRDHAEALRQLEEQRRVQERRDRDHAAALRDIERYDDSRGTRRLRNRRNFRRQLRNTFRRREDRGDQGPGFSRSRTDAIIQLSDATPDLLQNMTRFQKILVLIFALIVALTPVVATLIGVIGALSSALIASFAAVGVFALAAVGHFAKLKQEMEDAKKYGIPVKEQYKEAADAVNRLKDTYNAFLKATAGPVLGTFTRALNIANRALPIFTGLVSVAASAIDGAMNEAFDRLNSTGFSRFLAFVGRQAPPAILAFTKALLAMLAGFGELAVAFEPFIGFFTNGMVRMAQSFERFAQSLQAGGTRNSEFVKFMEYTQEIGPRVWQVFQNLVGALIDLGVALAPIGIALLTIVDAFARMISAIPTKVITGLAFAVLGLYAALRLLAIISVVIRAIQYLWGAFIAMRAATGALTISLYALRFALLSILALSAVGIVVAALAGLIGALITQTDDAAESTDKFAASQNALAAALEASNGKIDEGVKKAAIKNLQDTGLLAKGTRVGVSGQELTSAYLGSDEDFQKVIDKLEADRRRTIEQPIDTGEGAKPRHLQIQERALEREEIDKTIEGAKTLRKQYLDEVEARKQRDAAIYANVGNVKTEAEATDLLKQKIKDLIEAQASPTDKAVDSYRKYTDAQRKYTDALEAQRRATVDTARAVQDAARRQADAETAVERSQRNALRAQEALTRAREEATQKVIEMRRVLRDLPLDEEAARIAKQRADEAAMRARVAPGSTGLDLREALLEQKRASNALNDLLEDQPGKARDAQRTIDKGVEGSDTVQDAIEQQRQALVEQTRAAQDAQRAAEDYDRALKDAKKSNEDAARAVKDAGRELHDAAMEASGYAASLGLTLDGLGKLSDKIDAMRAAGNLNIQIGVDSGDTLNVLNEVMTAYAAMNLLKANPGWTVDQAWAEARKQSAGFLPKAKRGQSQNPDAQDRRFMSTGGAVDGSGPGTVDTVPAMLAPGEHVWTAAEVVAVGGHTMLKAIREAALGRKAQAAQAPGSDRLAAELFKVAGVYGRGAQQSFDPSALYATLNRTAMARASMPTVTANAGVAVNHTNVRGAFSVGDVTINNPVREPSGASLYRTVRRFSYDHEK